uniref:Uncharacterized protein n=1 Tax=Rhizophora mucronata TaxID=61149 RepID=A0A2P2QJB0_RHIMU
MISVLLLSHVDYLVSYLDFSSSSNKSLPFIGLITIWYFEIQS